MGVEKYGTFSEVRECLDAILVEVRKKELSLEKSLDLYEEAVQLGNRCAELVDKSDFSAEEAEAAMKLIEKDQTDGESAVAGTEDVLKKDEGAAHESNAHDKSTVEETAASEDDVDEENSAETECGASAENIAQSEVSALSETEETTSTEPENTTEV